MKEEKQYLEEYDDDFEIYTSDDETTKENKKKYSET